jgi:hypothetical protein
MALDSNAATSHGSTTVRQTEPELNPKKPAKKD